MTGKLFRPGADSDSSESWNRNRFLVNVNGGISVRIV